MTDNEITKALECCNKPVGSNSCVDCPLYETDNCSETMIIFALDLINRQKAEIERLKSNLHRLETMSKYRVAQIDNLHAEIQRLQYEKENLIETYKECALEVVKEFAERLNNLILPQLATSTLEKREVCYFCLDEINNILKEMGVEG